jgi:subtilisin family serine protease
MADVSPTVELDIDEDAELPADSPLLIPSGSPRIRTAPIAVVPGNLLVRDEDFETVDGAIAADERLRVTGREPLGGGWTVVSFEHPGVEETVALTDALLLLNGPDAPHQRPDRTPLARLNRIVGCPRLMGGGLPAAPDPANAPADPPPLGEGPGAGVTVAVFDTVPIHHPDLESQVDGMPDENPPLPTDSDTRAAGHCLLVAGIVLRFAPAAKVRLIGVLENDGVGNDATLARELHKLADAPDGVALVNLSLCTPASRLPVVEEALQRLHALGMGIVAAAGNVVGKLPDTHKMLPAGTESVVGVAAVVHEGTGLRYAQWSQRGDWVGCVSRGAGRYGPFITGVNFYGKGVRREFEGWCYWRGTSFAAPVVTGAAAALLAEHPEMTGAQALAEVVADAGVATLPDGSAPLFVDPQPSWPASDPGLLATARAVA